jgi:hypothetical protein
MPKKSVNSRTSVVLLTSAGKVELMTRLADPASYTSSGLEEGFILRQTIPVLSQYLVDAAKQIQKLAEPAKITLPYIAADQKRHIGEKT